MRYYVTTYDWERGSFTPQAGVCPGPYTLFGLRVALRALRALGYSTDREGAHSVLVENARSYGERIGGTITTNSYCGFGLPKEKQ